MTHRTSHRTRAEERIDEIDVSPTKLLEEIERLKAELAAAQGELAAAQSQADENLATLQRTAADFQNYRRRTTEERERDAGLASEFLILKVLVLADDFDRAIEAMPAEHAGDAWIDGVVAIDRKLRTLLESEGVSVLEAVGRTFDPREHEAIANVPGTGRPEGEVVAEVQRGYRLRDRVLRPALVAVASGSTAAPDRGPDSPQTEPPAAPGPTGPGTTDDRND
jgi:molecular chaperone GrpE